MSAKTFFTDIYGISKYNSLAEHIRSNLYNNKARLGNFKFDDGSLAQLDIAGKFIRGISTRINRRSPDLVRSDNGLNSDAVTLVDYAEKYRRYLKDPDLLPEINFVHTGSEIEPVSGQRFDCYEGFINGEYAQIRVNNNGLKITEKVDGVKKETYLGSATEILFSENDENDTEQIVRKIFSFKDYLTDWLKIRWSKDDFRKQG